MRVAVGNDIVDRTLQSDMDADRFLRFLKKVFRPEERELIQGSQDPFLWVNLLWSVKESTYKLYRKMGGERFLNPRRIEVKWEGPEIGTARCGELEVRTYSQIGLEFVHSFAVEKDRGVDTIQWRMETKAANTAVERSFAVRKLMLSMASETLGLPEDQLEIRKNKEQVPVLFSRTLDQPIPGFDLSLSHDGSFVACCWSLG